MLQSVLLNMGAATRLKVMPYRSEAIAIQEFMEGRSNALLVSSFQQASFHAYKMRFEKTGAQLNCSHIDASGSGNTALIHESLKPLCHDTNFHSALQDFHEVVLSSSRIQGLVYKKRVPSTWWQWVKPFTDELWGGIVAMMLVFTMAITLIEALERFIVNPNEPHSGYGASELRTCPHVRTCMHTCPHRASLLDLPSKGYHVWLVMLQDAQYTWASWPSRLLHISLLFFALLTVSTYEPLPRSFSNDLLACASS